MNIFVVEFIPAVPRYIRGGCGESAPGQDDHGAAVSLAVQSGQGGGPDQ